jgi:hypothetical protein
MKKVWATVLIVFTAALLWGGGGRRKLGDLDLSKFTNHQTGMAAQVWGIRFSPDETKVAIGFGPQWNFDPRPRHVVVVAVDQPQTLREFELDIGSPLPSGGKIVWSPSGTILVARDRTPVMFRLGEGAACAFPKESEFGGFAENDKVAVDQCGIASSGGDLLAITDSKYVSHHGKFWEFLDMENEYSVPQRQLIWNVRTGKEIASWVGVGGFDQTELWGRDLNRASKIRTPLILSLSRKGRYVAEGGSGSVSVHAVQP